MQGYVNLGIAFRIDPPEPGRRDSDDREWSAVDQDGPSDRGRVAGEALLPIRIADHSHGHCPPAVVVVADQASGRGRYAQPLIKTARHKLDVAEFGMVFGHDIDLPRSGVCE